MSERGLLTKVGSLSTLRHQDKMDGACELWVSHESFGFLIKAQKKEGKEHDTSPLGGSDPDKHVYALGSLNSELNKKGLL